jgi:hypothetical protein
MNARGDILGVAAAAGATSQPVVWPAGTTTPVVLPSPPGWTPASLNTYSAVDINARGEVVGVYSNRGNEVRPIRWPTATQPPELLETDNRLSIDVQGIGDDGTVIGTWFASPAGAPSTTTVLNPSNRRALVWDPVR